MDKNTIINNGIYDIFLNRKRELYIQGYDTDNKTNYLSLFDEETIITCFKIYQANKKRKQYGLEELSKWTFAINKSNHYKEYKIIFGTLTFSDKVLEKTTSQTRRRYVARFLTKHCENYMANVDYGKENGREHYHFIALIGNNIEKGAWNYGYDSYTKIKIDSKELKKVKNYLLKLNNHSYKASTKINRIIMNKAKKGIDLVDIIIENNINEYRKYKALLNA